MSIATKFIVGGVIAASVGTFIGNTPVSPKAAQTQEQGKQDEDQSKSDEADSADKSDAPQVEDDEQKIADGTHCVGGWDLTFSPLIDSVKAQLRNPQSFEHVSTIWTRVGKDGKFGLIMQYRAENGFGGLNVEAAGALINARTCAFEQVSPSTMEKRLRRDAVHS